MLHADYTLADADCQKFNADGWICLKQVLTDAVLAEYAHEIRKLTDEFARKHYTKPVSERDTYGKAFIQHENLFVNSDKVKEFVMSKKLGKIAATLMGVDGVRVYHDQALFKEPGPNNPTPFHQDQIYWPLDCKTCTMWMPLSNTAAKQGTMHFASKSQSLGYMGRMPISDESEQQLKQLIQNRGFQVEFAGDLKAGDATFHDGFTIHGAVGNDSDSMREAMTIIFYEDKSKIIEPDSPERRNDLARWFPGLQPGDVAASPINPLTYHRCWDKRFKLIATDLDGTLVKPDGQISKRTVAALDRARHHAILVLVTGRPARWLNSVIEQLVHDHEGAVVICSNGAIIMDCVTKQFLSVREIPVDVLRKVVTFAEHLIPGGCGFACERTTGFRRHDGYQPRAIGAGTDNANAVLAMEDLLSEPCVKLLIRPNQDWTSDELMMFLAPAVANLVQITHATPKGVGLLECSSLGTTKAHMLESYATSLGISREDVISFGDQPNDIEMLQWAGCGVAMGDGHVLAKQAAHCVTDACEDDGVARILEAIYH